MSHRPTRLQSSVTNAPTPASIAKASTNEQPAASSAFSASSFSRETRPRSSRASVFSSRSSARPPAACSTHTNISEMLTATTTAKVSSGVRRPCTRRESTWIGCPIVESTVLEAARFSAAKVANVLMRSSCARSRAAAAAGR